MITSGTIFIRWEYNNEDERIKSGTACFITGIVNKKNDFFFYKTLYFIFELVLFNHNDSDHNW